MSSHINNDTGIDSEGVLIVVATGIIVTFCDDDDDDDDDDSDNVVGATDTFSAVD